MRCKGLIPELASIRLPSPEHFSGQPTSFQEIQIQSCDVYGPAYRIRMLQRPSQTKRLFATRLEKKIITGNITAEFNLFSYVFRSFVQNDQLRNTGKTERKVFAGRLHDHWIFQHQAMRRGHCFERPSPGKFNQRLMPVIFIKIRQNNTWHRIGMCNFQHSAGSCLKQFFRAALQNRSKLISSLRCQNGIGIILQSVEFSNGYPR